ncbi:hypothetical protein HAX54_037966, partial [Datura stramonium]|nr:hypothetical protein [Datura stramonium]
IIKRSYQPSFQFHLFLAPALSPSLKVYSRRPQPSFEPTNPVSISNSNTCTQSTPANSLPTPRMSRASSSTLIK